MLSNTPTFSEFNGHFGVSRETYEKLVTYGDLLKHWQSSINLISPKSIPHLWSRHIADCYQLVSHVTEGNLVTDIGSGAGLPGIILSIAGVPVTLVESDGKKVAFLREAKRLLGLDCTINHARAESIQIESNQVVTARAFASILTVLQTLQNTLNSTHKLMLFKGKNYESEYKEALAQYVMDSRFIPSITESDSALVILSNVQLRGTPL